MMKRHTAALLLLALAATAAHARELLQEEAESAPAPESSAPAANPYSARFDDQPTVADAKIGSIGSVTVRVLTGATATALTGVVGTDVTTHHVTLGPCTSLAPHYHPNADELQYVIEGEFTFAIVDMNGTLWTKSGGPGMVNFIPHGPSHYIANESCKNSTVILVFDGPVSRVNLAPTATAMGQPMFNDMLGLSAGTTVNTPMGDAIPITSNDCPAKCEQKA